MSDPFQHARPGQDLAIPAAVYNAAIDAARAVRAGRLAAGRPDAEGGSRSAWIVPVVNDTGGDLGRNSVVCLSAPAVLPSDSVPGFLGRPAFRATAGPGACTTRFGVTLDAIPAGRAGRAYAAGVFPVRVDVSDAGHACAVAGSSSTALASTDSGPAQILWRELADEPYGGLGEQWAIVRRGPWCGPADDVPDDFLGCCSYLPATNLSGQVVAYDDISDSTYVIPGPFVRRTGAVQLVVGQRTSDIGEDGDDRYVFTGEGPWYEAALGCWTREWFRVIDPELGDPLPPRIEFFGASTTVYAVVACTIWTPDTWPAELDPNNLTTIPRTRLFLIANNGSSYRFWVSLVDGTIDGDPFLDPADYFPTSGLLSGCADTVPDDCEPTLGPNIADCFPTRTVTDDGMGNISGVFNGHYCFNFAFDYPNLCASFKSNSVWGIGEGGGITNGLDAVSCDPLCFRSSGTYTSSGGFPVTESDANLLSPTGVPVDGTVIGGIDLPGCPLPDDFCTVELWFQSWCPSLGCPADGALFWAEDLTTGVVYGPREFQSLGLDGECLILAWSIRVRIELDAFGEPIGVPRTFRLYGVNAEEEEETFTTVVVEGCEPERVVVNYDPPVFRFKVVVHGCPATEPMEFIPIDFVIYEDDDGDPGAVITTLGTFTGTGGLTFGEIARPALGEDPIVRHIGVRTAAESPGYAANEVVFGPFTIPAVGTCAREDLGTVVLPPNEDHVCSCGGLIQKCLTWDGNGSPVQVEWDAGEGAWIGLETVFDGVANDEVFCLDEPPAGIDQQSDLPVRLEIGLDGEDCVAEFFRLAPYCVCGPDFGSPPCRTAPCAGVGPNGGTPRLAGFDAENPTALNFAPGYQRVELEIWGPQGAFPGIEANAWTRPNGDADPDRCWAPNEAYQPAEVNNCTTEPEE